MVVVAAFGPVCVPVVEPAGCLDVSAVDPAVFALTAAAVFARVRIPEPLATGSCAGGFVFVPAGSRSASVSAVVARVRASTFKRFVGALVLEVPGWMAEAASSSTCARVFAARAMFR